MTRGSPRGGGRVRALLIEPVPLQDLPHRARLDARLACGVPSHRELLLEEVRAPVEVDQPLAARVVAGLVDGAAAQEDEPFAPRRRVRARRRRIVEAQVLEREPQAVDLVGLQGQHPRRRLEVADPLGPERVGLGRGGVLRQYRRRRRRKRHVQGGARRRSHVGHGLHLGGGARGVRRHRDPAGHGQAGLGHDDRHVGAGRGHDRGPVRRYDHGRDGHDGGHLRHRSARADADGLDADDRAGVALPGAIAQD
ncbi:MAG: hypothetical protein DMF82_23525, partial [Acidobacteria bacterium]